MKHNGGIGEGGIAWTSNFSSVIASFSNICFVDGINEAGLGADMLCLAEGDFGDCKTDGNPLMSIEAWLQYALDNYGTAAEAVNELSKEPFVIVEPIRPDGDAASGHVILTDEKGDSAVFECLNGKFAGHHGAVWGYDELAASRSAARDLDILK